LAPWDPRLLEQTVKDSPRECAVGSAPLQSEVDKERSAVAFEERCFHHDLAHLRLRALAKLRLRQAFLPLSLAKRVGSREAGVLRVATQA
jgi:hypothetical protein